MALAQAGEWPAQTAPRVMPMRDRLEHLWTSALPSDDARLAPIADRLWVAFADGRLFELRPSGPGFEDEPSALLAPGGYRPAYGSDPVYVTDGGDVGRWAPDAGWRAAWSAGLPGPAIDAFGLPGARVLLSSSQWADATRLLDERAAAVAWSLPVVSPRVLAVSGIALGWQAGRLHAIELSGGRILWRREGVLAAAALSEASAWLADESGGLVEVAAWSGATSAEHELPGGVPSFALAPDGRLYVVGRPLEVRVFELLGGIRPVCTRPYPEMVLDGVPRALALAPDGRLVVVTGHAVLELRPEHDDAIRELWRTDQLIVDAMAQDGQLAVVTIDDRGHRFLTFFDSYGAPAGRGALRTGIKH